MTIREYIQENGLESLKLILTEKGKKNIKFPNWFVSDCRFVNEANAIKERNGLIIRINRNYSWESFSKLYGLENTLSPTTNSKESPIFWGEYLKTLPPSEEIQTAIKKIFHSSETSLDDYEKFDYVINNFGTLEDFENEIDKCLNFLGLLN